MRVSSAYTLSAISLAATICAFAPDQGLAAERIGLAMVVRNHVAQVEPAYSRIMTGDDIHRDEVVQTFAESSAKFVLRDSTNLMLAPGSKLKLDRAVFSDETGIGDIAIRLALGAFRFITGNSSKESYRISTPVATIGVRGTTLDLKIEQFKNTIVNKAGEARVCAGQQCVELTHAGDTAVITSVNSRINIDLQGSSSWTFDSACNGMCAPTSFAEAEHALTTGSIGGGGSGGGGGGILPTLRATPVFGTVTPLGSRSTFNNSASIFSGLGGVATASSFAGSPAATRSTAPVSVSPTR